MDEIPYFLHENTMLDGETLFRATVRSKGTANHDDILDFMVSRYSKLTLMDADAAVKAYHAAIRDLIKLGYRINTELVNIGFSIKGNFEHEEDALDRSRHNVRINISSGRMLRDLPDQLQLVKKETIILTPNPLQYTNPNNGDSNEILTPGGLGKVTGRRLAFDPADPKQGLFLVAADKSETRAEAYGEIAPRKLIFLVPAGLASGTYILEVRAIFNNNENDLRSGKLQQPLQVP